MSEVYELWDFLDGRKKNIILQWVKDDRLTMGDRAKLNNKIKRLSQLDFELAKSTKLLAGPIHKHIYKLIIHGDVMLRPMLCCGPINKETEYTFLHGAVETGGKLPPTVAERAEENREAILNDPTRRCKHARIV